MNTKVLLFLVAVLGVAGVSARGADKIGDVSCAWSAEEQQPGQPRSDWFVMFNNDYQMLYEENEALARKDPRNPDKYLLELINSATGTLRACFYDVNDLGVVRALMRAHKRGVNVQVVTESSNMQDKTDPTKPRLATEMLTKAGIKIRGDERRAFMHHKFMVVDDREVWMGSMNLTSEALYRDNNNSLWIRSPELAADLTAEFRRLYEEGLFESTRHDMPYPEVIIQGDRARMYFSPEGGGKAAIMEALLQARKSIRFMAFSFTDKDMGNLLISKKRDGLLVEGVFDDCQIDKNSMYSAFRQNHVFVMRDGNQALMHHKVMILDEAVVITGSFNFSRNAERNNNEDLIVIHSPRLAACYVREYERIKHAALTHKNIPPYDHPACQHPDRQPAKESGRGR